MRRRLLPRPKPPVLSQRHLDDLLAKAETPDESDAIEAAFNDAVDRAIDEREERKFRRQEND